MVISPFSSFPNAFINGSAGTNPAAAIAALNGLNLGGASSTQQLTGQQFPGFQNSQFTGINGFTPQNTSLFSGVNSFTPQLAPQLSGQLFSAQNNPVLALGSQFPAQATQNPILLGLPVTGLGSNQFSQGNPFGQFLPTQTFNPNGGFVGQNALNPSTAIQNPGGSFPIGGMQNGGFPSQTNQTLPGAGAPNNINIFNFNFFSGPNSQSPASSGNPFQPNGQSPLGQFPANGQTALQTGALPPGYGQLPLPAPGGQQAQQNPFNPGVNGTSANDQTLSLMSNFMNLFSQFMNIFSSPPQNSTANNNGAGVSSPVYQTPPPPPVNTPPIASVY